MIKISYTSAIFLLLVSAAVIYFANRKWMRRGIENYRKRLSVDDIERLEESERKGYIKEAERLSEMKGREIAREEFGVK